jgi:hypothetical protein
MRYNLKSLFTYLDERFDDLEAKVASVDEKFSDLSTSTEHMVISTKSNSDELKITNHRLNSIEEWIRYAASKIGIKK